MRIKETALKFSWVGPVLNGRGGGARNFSIDLMPSKYRASIINTDTCHVIEYLWDLAFS